MESRLLRPTKARDAQMKSAAETRHGAEKLASTSPPPMHFGRLETFSQVPSPSPPPAAHQRRTVSPGNSSHSTTSSRNHSRFLSVPSSFNRAQSTSECRRSQAPPNASSLSSCSALPMADDTGSVRALAPLQRNSPAPAPHSTLPCHRVARRTAAVPASRKRAREEGSSSSSIPLRSRAPTRMESIASLQGDPESCSSTFSPREKPQRVPMSPMSTLRRSSPRDSSRGRVTRLTDVTVSTVSDECEDDRDRDHSSAFCDTTDGSTAAPYSVVLDTHEPIERLSNDTPTEQANEIAPPRTSDVLSTSDEGPSTIGGISSIEESSSTVVVLVAAGEGGSMRPGGGGASQRPRSSVAAAAGDTRAAAEIHEAMELYNAASMIRLTENFSDLERRWAELYRKGECRDTQQILTERQTPLPEFSCDSDVFLHLAPDSIVEVDVTNGGSGAVVSEERDKPREVPPECDKYSGARLQNEVKPSGGSEGCASKVSTAVEPRSPPQRKQHTTRDDVTFAAAGQKNPRSGSSERRTEMWCSGTVSPPSQYRGENNSTHCVAENNDSFERYGRHTPRSTPPSRRTSSFSPSNGSSKRRTNGTTGRPALLRPLSTPPADEDSFASARASVTLVGCGTLLSRRGGHHSQHRPEGLLDASGSSTVDVAVQTWARGGDGLLCDIESAASLLGIDREVATYMMRSFGRVLVQSTAFSAAAPSTPPQPCSAAGSSSHVPGDLAAVGHPLCVSAQRSANGSPLLMDDSRMPIRGAPDADLLRESVVHRIVYHSAEPLPEPHTTDLHRRHPFAHAPPGFAPGIPTPSKRNQR